MHVRDQCQHGDLTEHRDRQHAHRGHRACGVEPLRPAERRHPLEIASAPVNAVRRAGLDAVRRQWPGTDDGFAALTQLTGLNRPEQPSAPGSDGESR
jgi:hypothetical protein